MLAGDRIKDHRVELHFDKTWQKRIQKLFSIRLIGVVDPAGSTLLHGLHWQQPPHLRPLYERIHEVRVDDLHLVESTLDEAVDDIGGNRQNIDQRWRITQAGD